MNVLVIGSGGREHAIIRKFSASSKIQKIYVLPGNPGMKKVAELVKLKSFDEIEHFIKTSKIDFVFIGPEQPLADGLSDKLLQANIPVIGPDSFSAQIETSKVFAKEFMKNNKIPTADYNSFNDASAAFSHLEVCKYPVVIKADGLAAGKGVVIASDKIEAKAAVETMMLQKKFGKAGLSIVIEEYLQGWEVSVFAFADGNNYVSTIFSQDHKAILDGDKGANTGGMGAYAPVKKAEIYKSIIDKEVFEPVIRGFKEMDHPYKGILFAGLMITEQGPKVLEFNARLGDPETEVILPLLKNDFVDICEAMINNQIDKINLEWENSFCVTVVAASGGYPEEFKKGYEISLSADFKEHDNLILYTGGVSEKDDKLYTDGGRVLMLTSKEVTLEKAIDNVYNEIKKVSFTDIYYRKDIAHKGLQ